LENIALDQAGQFYELKLAKRCFMQFYGNALQAKKELSAHAYYLESLKKRAIEYLYAYAEKQKAKGSPNVMVRQFRQRHSSSLIKECVR